MAQNIGDFASPPSGGFRGQGRLGKLFANKKNNVLNIYCTAGYPKLDSTLEVINALQDNGADIIEIGMPYSDPLADGEVIQQSSAVALQNGMTIAKLFEQLKDVRRTIHVPVILMGYLNPIMQYGLENFCAKAKEVGVDGVILPDLPMYEYETMYKPLFDANGLDFIFLVTPETSEERIRKIDALGSGFIYAVSSSSTTGKNKAIEEQETYFKKLQAMQLKNPVLVGFGIKDKPTFEAASRYTNGAIIGSAYIKALENAVDTNNATASFLNKILK
jgi:tryptophan synthase alpha chain